MKAIILNASAWMIVPVMDAFAKYLSSSMDVLQITWARYFFTGFYLIFNVNFLQTHTSVDKKTCTSINKGIDICFFYVFIFLCNIRDFSS